MRQRPLKLSVLAGLLFVLAPSCLQAPSARVGVRPVTAEIAFGIPPLDEPVGLPGTGDVVDPIADTGGSFSQRQIPRPPIIPRPPDCDEADNKQVRLSPTTAAINSPPQGNFRWRGDGFSSIAGTTNKLKIDTFSTRTFSDYKVETKDARGTPLDWFFKSRQRDPDGSTVDITWHVVKSKVVDNPVTNSRTDTGLNGLFITKIVRSKSGQPDRVFEPSPEVAYLVFPADVNDRFGFEQSYVDGRSQETWQLSGQIKENKDFDACGELVLTRWVDGTLRVVSSEGSREYNYDYGIGTQYGGILMADAIQECPVDNRYNEAETANRKCSRAAGTQTEYAPFSAEYTRYIGQVPPDY